MKSGTMPRCCAHAGAAHKPRISMPAAMRFIVAAPRRAMSAACPSAAHLRNVRREGYPLIAARADAYRTVIGTPTHRACAQAVRIGAFIRSNVLLLVACGSDDARAAQARDIVG